jgi:hypothetical protein
MILYKYCSPERLDILQNCQVRFTQPNKFNDPFELLPSYTDKVSSEYAFMNWGEGIDKSYRELRMAGFNLPALDKFEESKNTSKEKILNRLSTDPYYANLMLWGSVYPLFSSIFVGVLCLTEKPNNLLMWSHYASSCKGFVIGFDTTNNWFNGNTGHNGLYTIQKVKYDDKRPSEKLDEAIFAKGKDWSYEEEWRIISAVHDCTQVSDGSDIFVKNFPMDSVVSLIIGCKMRSKDRIELLKQSKKFPNAELYRSYPDPRKYEMEIYPYDESYQLPTTLE